MSEINLAVCRMCGDILHSKHTNDFVKCGCPNESWVDGGPDYKTRSGKDLKLVIDCITMSEARRLAAGFKADAQKKKKAKEEAPKSDTVLAKRFDQIKPGEQFIYCGERFLRTITKQCLGNVAGHHTDGQKAAQSMNSVNLSTGEVYFINNAELVAVA